MKQTVLMEKYPIYTIQINKQESLYADVDQIIGYFKEKIEADPVAAYIGEFDHYGHTETLGGEINPDINAAKIVIFCFGQKLPNPQIMAARPRSIGVADMGGHFTVSFLEAPMEAINTTLQSWVKGLIRH